jgi:16S rRNA (guanine527-N7)-methyltransferase
MSYSTKRTSAWLALGTIADAISPFGIHLPEEKLAMIQEYVSMLLHWNQSINLTAIDNPVEIVARHFGESLFAANFLHLESSRLADVGAGAGFPGLPMKIAFPSSEVVLFESDARKCAFLREVVQRLEISGVDVRHERYEEFPTEGGKFDFICARAIGGYPAFLKWARRLVSARGRVVLWLGTEDSIRIGRRKDFVWDPPVVIPESKRRVILVGRATL